MVKLNVAVKYLQDNDIVMKGIIKRVGPCVLTRRTDYYCSLVKSIVYQQLAVKAAKTIYDRFLAELNNDLTPKKVFKLTELQFKKAGISERKKSYLIDLSNKFLNGYVTKEYISKLSDEEIISHLTEIRGIGRWSAEMFLIFTLNRQNILPLDDLGFRRALKINYSLKNMPSKEKILKISKKWGAYRSIAVWYLWQSINTK